jgi:hypothetical protein
MMCTISWSGHETVYKHGTLQTHIMIAMKGELLSIRADLAEPGGHRTVVLYG